MRALTLVADRKVELLDVPEPPPPGANEVQIRIKAIGLKAFVAAVLGGIGNIMGAALGGFLIGVAEQLTAGYISADYRDAITFAILIGVLLVRPQGMLGSVRAEKV